jgi:alpha-N-acetylglucosaminidase (NAGLU)-like protein
MHSLKCSIFTLFCVFLSGFNGIISGQAASLSSQSTSSTFKPITILIPPTGEKAYVIAGEAFADMWVKVTGEQINIEYMKSDNKELPDGDIILIGSDAVNPIVHNLIRSGTLEGLGIVYGGDNYRMLSVEKERRNYLILAGGSGRSTIYAVYDFFRKQAGVEYFWDGDVIPHSDQIQLTGIDVYEQPRFEYRGLRYFAHRGLHRFQAEHWDLEDWKKEIDWLTKKRFNMFMLRTGTDDLFQRTFPDVPYPPVDGHDPDGGFRTHYDRTSFWQLKYRGELRKQVLQYARDRGLLHPEDVGTITHWYSATPESFFKTRPDFPLMPTGKSNYFFPRHSIWDIETQIAWDAYWKLTETHINEFGGGSPRLFHTIGLAERSFGSSRENLQNKLYVYRKTQQKLREHYPDVPLLIASWDFFGQWKNNEVKQLLDEFDQERTIILDYTADNISTTSYRDWGLFNEFPWIFGIIHSFANNSDIHGDYKNIIAPRLQEASADSKCIGLVTWSEISHSDTYLLEYVADNSWQPKRLEVEKATERYCDSRYPAEIAKTMKPLWSSFLSLSQSHNWGRTSGTVREPQFRILTSSDLINLTPDRIKKLEADLQRLQPGLKRSTEVLKGLAEMADKDFENPFWQRDAIDMARTISSSAYLASMEYGAILMDAWSHKKSSPSEIKQFAKLSQKLLSSMSDILSLSDDFSMYASLNKLSDAREIEGVSPSINSHTEQTLKGNAEGNYCRSHHYELVEYVYRYELDTYWNWVLKRIKSGDRTEWKKPDEFDIQEKRIADRFYDTPLAEMAPTLSRDSKNMADIFNKLEKQVTKLLNEIRIEDKNTK